MGVLCWPHARKTAGAELGKNVPVLNRGKQWRRKRSEVRETRSEECSRFHKLPIPDRLRSGWWFGLEQWGRGRELKKRQYKGSGGKENEDQAHFKRKKTRGGTTGAVTTQRRGAFVTE